jgi:flagella basal body P-ring formation protein FlgA
MGAACVTTTFRRLGALALLALAAPAGAQAFEDLGQLEMVVAAALGAGIGEPGGASRPLDRRLKLKACPEPAVIAPPALGAVAVSCPSVGWRIRVPLVYTPRAAVQTLAQAAPAEPIVRKGDQIELTASSGAFTVSTVAVAEQDGVPGARIRVRSEGRKGAVIGVVMEDGRVSLPGFK